MRKFLSLLSLITIVGSMCFSQQSMAQGKSTQAVVTQATINSEQTFVGLFVNFVPVIRLVQASIPFPKNLIPGLGLYKLMKNHNVFGKVVLVSDKGEQGEFIITSSTAITDINGIPVHRAPKKGIRVEIKYAPIRSNSVITNGQNGAISVHYLN